ncbi:bifunctional folylpolyglutamate synthase/dihydrofolate synthase [Geomonas anaerohicana]|uniref:Dihydrofolate synthase/folylpolyglutamate synthase n=1 Tax=Geomonas anaerohicana TaxID=2798583 RepID=A0ABS0YE20_9BACT|nr:folylpolyglutamate synthase/dihydrofolate synthase family protein [Geomonas anaerohicana]MBJ6750389.1 bifunctional folylpolyglutamate synthase/dihydrofolate synthase [Geomonas anaerohicana]
MTYAETLAHIYALGRFGIKPGLDRITALLAALGNPQDAFKAVHVVGTNGKGSTASFLSSILKAGGYRTGLFTSPHLISFTERIQVNGSEIGEADVVRFAGMVMAAAPAEATFFEIVTALAILHFAEAGVEIAVFEAGMGGRLDATNILQGVLCAIAPISLEHTDYLGKTIEDIAAEKAGICKPGAPILSARQDRDAQFIIEHQAAQLDAPLYRQGESFDAFWLDGLLNYRGIGVTLDALSCGLYGRYQSGNAALALACAELLRAVGFPVTPQAMIAGVANARWPGRMEFFPGPPRLLLDGAHNPAGAAALAEALADIPRGQLFLVAGVMADKELSGILAPLLPLVDRVFAVAPALERALPAGELATYCFGAGVEAMEAGSVAQGIELARNLAQDDDLILVCGSLFTVGEARSHLKSRSFEAFRG